MIRSILKSNFIMILILKTHLAIRIRAAVTLLHSVVIRFSTSIRSDRDLFVRYLFP